MKAVVQFAIQFNIYNDEICNYVMAGLVAKYQYNYVCDHLDSFQLAKSLLLINIIQSRIL